MSTFIQQPFHLVHHPGCIPTFDHGLRQTVYVNIPTDQFGERVSIEHIWRLRRLGGIHWEYYCNCTPPQNSPGVPARSYDVKKPSSPYFGRTYLGCGKTKKRCQWKVRLDQIFTAAKAHRRISPTPPASPTESEFPDSEQFDDSFNDSFTQALAELEIKGSQASIQPSSVEQPILQDDNAFGKLLGGVPLSEEEHDTSAQKAAGNVVGDGTLSEEIAEAIRELAIGNSEGNATLSTELEQGLCNLTLSDNEGLDNMHMIWNEAEGEWQLPVAAYQELVAAFAGQDDVYVAPDGTVHFIPDYAPENTLSEGITGDNEYSGDELGDLTLVDALMNVGSDEFKLTPKPFNADDMDVDLAVELPSKYLSLDLTVEESSSPAAQPEVRQCGYIDLTAGEFFDRGKRKRTVLLLVVSLPEGHKMYVDLTLGGSLPHEITTPGSGTFEDPFDLTI
ncbi:hypothetical protein C8R41DRAFT_869503 [Lentinula lateritia]|uniref:Uncharacterized protein n=1 Tax=Lentinula lateritia TaxID=40482 RepID=A0ABQ8V7S2_9AGAR|nr:hypothetical protein C8R41DRAFT_869503 [Lentinula lateritia]